MLDDVFAAQSAVLAPHLGNPVLTIGANERVVIWLLDILSGFPEEIRIVDDIVTTWSAEEPVDPARLEGNDQDRQHPQHRVNLTDPAADGH